MNLIEALLSNAFAHPLGWTLLHFVWQGALVALLLAVALRLLRHRSAQARYVVSCAALLLLLALPIITLSVLWPVAPEGVATVPVLQPGAASVMVPLPEIAAPTPSETSASWWQAAYATLGGALPWLVLIWMAGVLTLSMRYLAGWTYTLRLRRRGTRAVGQRWQEQRARLAKQLGVTRPVRLMASALVQVPTVAGWLRPIILMPVGVFTGLTPRQVEMVIAHELAHIRRHDYLVNLMQAMCETLLFYHPAVWWVSQRIRVEREHCCDDLVVAVCGDAFTYAEALTKMEEDRLAAPRLALAATGGSLMDRVRRLLDGPDEAAPGAARWVAGLALVTVLLVSLLLSTAFDDPLDRAYAWLTESLAEETEHESRLFITTYDDRGVLLEQFGDQATAHPVRLKGPDVTVEMSEGSRLVVDDFNRPSPEGRLNSRDNTITFEGDLAMEIWKDDTKLNRLVAYDAVVVYARLGQSDSRPRPHPLGRDTYEDTAQRLERLVFDDPSQSVQMEALDELRRLPKRASLSPLINIAERHPRPQVRNEAVQWLGRIGDAYVVYTLERIAFDDADVSVQMEALDALRNLPEKIGLPSLMKIAQTHPRAEMRSEAVQWLRRIDGETARLLLERVLFEDVSPMVQEEAFDALENLIDNPWTYVQITEKHPNEAIRQKANRWLQRRRVKQGHLWNELREPNNWPLRTDQLSTGYQGTAEKLERLAFEDQNPAVRQEAFDALAKLPGRTIKPALTRVIETHPDAALRTKAALRLQEVAEEEAFNIRMVKALKTSRTAPLASERLAAVQTLKEWTAPQLSGSLAGIVFDDASYTVQKEAFLALREREGIQTMAYIARIARTHPNPKMRIHAVLSMGDMQADDRLPLLEEIAFNDEDSEVQREALLQLSDAPEVEMAVLALHRVVEQHPTKLLRRFAQRRLEVIRETDDEDDEEDYSWSQALDDLRHPSAQRRLKALDKIEEKKDIDLLPTLADMAYEDPSLDVQLDILDIFRDRGDWDGDSWVVHIAQNHPNARMRSEAVQSLNDQDPETLQPMLQHFVLEDESPDVQREALDRLADLPVAYSVPALFKIAQTHRDKAMRWKAIEALKDRDETRARQAIQENQ